MEFHQTLLVEGKKRLDAAHAGLPEQDREDVLQEALIDLARVIEKGGRVDNPAAFLAVIIDRTAATRAVQLTKLREDETPVGDTRSEQWEKYHPTTPDEFSPSAFDEAVRNLPDGLIDTFILCDLRGLTTYEAAVLLGVHQTTVSRDLSLARDIMKEAL